MVYGRLREKWNYDLTGLFRRIQSNYCRNSVFIEHICRDVVKICFVTSKLAPGFANAGRVGPRSQANDTPEGT
jgi:hypothetical protein